MIRLKKLLTRTLLSFALLLFAGFLAVAWFGSARLVSPPRRALQDYHLEILSDPERFGLQVTSFTGARSTPCLLVTPSIRPGSARKSRQLRKILQRNSVELPPWGELRGTVILLHGHTGRKEDHLPICERFCAAGFRCVIPDLPGHGENPSRIATFGKNESILIEEILDQALTTFSLPQQPTFLFGVSQGGAIALQVAARHPERWAGVASAASFASLDQPIRVSSESFHPHLRPLAPLSRLAVHCGAWVRGGIWPPNISPKAAAKSLSMPVLIAHGAEDRFIPIDQAREIFDAIPSEGKIFRPVLEADHNRVLAADAANFYPDVCTFFLHHLS